MLLVKVLRCLLNLLCRLRCLCWHFSRLRFRFIKAVSHGLLLLKHVAVHHVELFLVHLAGLARGLQDPLRVLASGLLRLHELRGSEHLINMIKLVLLLTSNTAHLLLRHIVLLGIVECGIDNRAVDGGLRLFLVDLLGCGLLGRCFFLH